MRNIILLTLGVGLFQQACARRKAPKEAFQSQEERCNRQPGILWINGACVRENSFAHKSYKCLMKGDGSKMEGERCVTPRQIANRQESCVRNGGTWNPSDTGLSGTCVSQESALNPRQICLQKVAHVWDPQYDRCLPPEGVSCQASQQNHWLDNGCRSEAYYQCSLKGGSIWYEEACRSREEQKCWLKGPEFSWDPKDRVCDRKNFADFCAETRTDGSIEKAVQRNLERHTIVAKSEDQEKVLASFRQQYKQLKFTVDAIIDREGFNLNCTELNEKLSRRGSLNLNNYDIVNPAPIVKFEKLKRLYLSRNKINDLTQISKLTSLQQLEELSLSKNGITEFPDLSSIRTLETLNLSINSIKKMPSFLSYQNLKSLDLSTNNLTNLDSLKAPNTGVEIKIFQSLTTINLSDNCELSAASNLEEFVNLERVNLKTPPSKRKTSLKNLL